MDSITDFFSVIQNEDYVVLRNYETLDSGFTEQLHPDIDLLCRNRDRIIELTGATCRSKNTDDHVHMMIVINGKNVDLDLRCIGDGYYDSNWEERILSSRVFWNNFCFVPNEQNYFFSLLYHVLIQKRYISDDYRVRLKDMAKRVGIETDDSVSIDLLETFMRNNGYKYTYPENPSTIFNIGNINHKLLEKNLKRKVERTLFRVKRKFAIKR